MGAIFKVYNLCSCHSFITQGGSVVNQLRQFNSLFRFTSRYHSIKSRAVTNFRLLFVFVRDDDNEGRKYDNIGSVMEGALIWNLQITDKYSIFITAVLQDLVNHIPMMHCTLKSQTVCSDADTSQAMEFLCIDILLQQKCLYLVSNDSVDSSQSKCRAV